MRFKSFFVVICLCACLCGCTGYEAVSNQKQEYIVSSLGFDLSAGELMLTVEALVVNSDDIEESKENRIITARGDNVKDAFSKLKNGITQPLSLRHNGIIAIGSNIPPQSLEDVFEALTDDSLVNIDTMVISTENAHSLLSAKPISSVTVGYDILSMVEVVEKEKGITFDNRLYKISAVFQKQVKAFSLPFIAISQGKFYFDGLNFYNKTENICYLNSRQAVTSGFVTDSVTSGEYLIDNRKMKLNYCKTRYDFSFEDKLVIGLNIHIKGECEPDIIKGEITQLCNDFIPLYGDIWGLGNIIRQKEPEIWSRIKNDYVGYFKKAEVRVNVYG